MSDIPEMYECTSCHEFWTGDQIAEGTAFADHGDHEGECPSCERDCHVVDPEDIPTIDEIADALKNLLEQMDREDKQTYLVATRTRRMWLYWNSAENLLKQIGIRLTPWEKVGEE